MISREEAMNIFDRDDGFTNEDSIAIVYDEIVKSMGSCGECKHGFISKTKVNCDELVSHMGDTWHDINWYCADFERRINELEPYQENV